MRILRRPSWTPETQPNGPVRRRLVKFLVFNSIYLKKNVSPDAEKVVRRRLVEFLVFNSAFGRHRQWLIPMKSPSFIIIVILSIIHHGLIFGGSPRNIKPWRMMDDITMMINEGDSIGINHCLCLPKAELNTKNSTYGAVWLSFWCSTRPSADTGNN